jgi:hypothetical protein
MGEPESDLRVAFKRVSSGLYSRLSSRFDSADPSRSYDYDNDSDDEEDILTCEHDSADQPSSTDVDLEMGVSSG